MEQSEQTAKGGWVGVYLCVFAGSACGVTLSFAQENSCIFEGVLILKRSKRRHSLKLSLNIHLFH